MYTRDLVFARRKFKVGYEMIKETVHEDEANEDAHNHYKSRSEDIKLDTEHNDNASDDYEADCESEEDYQEFIPKNRHKRQKNLQQSKKNITSTKDVKIKKQELIKKNSLARYNMKNQNETSRRLYSNDQFKVKRKYSNFMNQNFSISRKNETPIENLKLEVLKNTQSRNVSSALKPSEDHSRISFGAVTPGDSEESLPRKKILFSNFDNIKDELTTNERVANLEQVIIVFT